MTTFPAQAQTDDSGVQSRDMLGSPGIVDMPDARMAPDGQLSVGGSYFRNTQHYNFGFQVTPWLETSFRYSGLKNFSPGYPIYYDRSFAFKARLWNESDILPAIAVGVNDIIGTGIYSGEYLVASKQIGDIDATLGMGWGRLGTANTFKNPLGLVSNSFLNDRSSTDGPGSTNFNVLFHGRTVGIFGGVTWTTPLEGLLLSLEYSSDSYSHEAPSGNFVPKSQFNIGATYQVADNISLGMQYLYGESLAGSISFQLDPVHDPFPQRMGTQPSAPRIRTAEEQQQALERLAGRGGRRLASSSSAALVDALWQIAPTDMAVHGRTLSVRVESGDPALLCRTAAAAVAGRNLAFDTVSITRAGQTVHCPVTPQQPMAVNLTWDGDEDAAAPHHLVELAAAPVVIDAAAPAQPSRAAAIAAIRKDIAAQKIGLAALSLTGSDAVVYYTNNHYFHERDALDRLVRILMADAPPDIERFRLIAMKGPGPQREFDVLRAPTERSIEQTGSFSLAEGTDNGTPAPMRNPILAAAAPGLFPRFNWSVFPQFRQELFDPDNPFAVQFLAAGEATLELWQGLTLIAEGEVNLYDNFNVLRPNDSALPHVRSDFVKYFTQGKNGIGELEAAYEFRLAPTVFAKFRTGYLESMFAGVGGEVLWRPEGQRWALGGDLYEVKQRDFDRLFGLQPYHVLTGHVSLYYASPWYDLNFAVRAGQYLAGDHGITFEATRRFETGVEIGAFFTRTNVSAQQFGEGSFDKGIIIRIPIGWVAPVDTQAQFNLDLRPVQRDGGQRLLGDATLFDETRRPSLAEMQEQP